MFIGGAFVAKQRTINGITYRPRKTNTQSVVCSMCKRICCNLAFYEDTNTSNIFCLKCINVLTNKDKKDKMKSATSYPITRSLYVGKNSHQCGNSNDLYENTTFVFGQGENKVYIGVNRCKICGNYIISYNDYEKYKRNLKDYKLLSSKNNKPITESSGFVYYPRWAPKTSSDLPNHVQWAAKHPYSGGGFPPK